ncbi:MAG: homoserine O-acetyltransferase [Deltaproteobacteria bacterium]|nr:homoserine O-acetyltransferase [Deltaproteobacteria bacterium]
MEQTETKFFIFADNDTEAFYLVSGQKFGPITLAYETYGKLSPKKDNAILLFHALSGSQHAAGLNTNVPGAEQYWTEDCHVGWWNDYIGPHKALDTNRYFVICANYFGSCYGSTGPCSINLATNKPYGGAFPILTIEDVVNTQMKLLDHLGIDRLLAVIGGSLGGVMATDLAIRYPQRTICVVPIASGPYATTLHKLANFEQIYAIEMDPNFNYGNYYQGQPPAVGLTLARIIAHKTFVHLHVIEARARDQIIQSEDDLRGYKLQHQIESYMLSQGKKFIKRFDANSYLRIVNMWQQFDLRRSGGGNLATAFKNCKQHNFLLFSIDSDVCFWPEEQDWLSEALKANDIDHVYITLHSEKGHDSFLLEPELYTANIKFLLKETYRQLVART